MSALTNTFTDIADAIRAKTSTTITYKPTEMANAINNISSVSGMTLEDTSANVLRQFNLPVTISNSVTNMNYCFANCYNFNQPITIPNSVTIMDGCFHNCSGFNQPITIPNSVTSMSSCFAQCYNFNQSIVISNNVTSLVYCFANCYNFNQPITIPNKVTSLAYCFANCYNFNQPITIPNKVTNMISCFANCKNFGSTIRIVGNSISGNNVKNMFGGCNNRKVKTIITNNVTPFLGNVSTNSIVGAAITWTKSGSNYYNTAYNIYVNYSANPLA